MKKKDWYKPKLSVLIRGNAEESVLGGCKNVTFDPPSGGPEGQKWCGWNSETGDYCHGTMSS